MRRVAATAVLVAALVGVVGAESALKARNAALPHGTITVEEVDSVTVEAAKLDSPTENATLAAQSANSPRDVAYAMH